MQRMWYLLSKAGLFALVFVLLTSSAALADNVIRIGCPIDVPTPDGDSVLIPVYITNDVSIGAYTLPFNWNSTDVVITSYDLTGTCMPTMMQFMFMLTIFPGEQKVLPGAIDFSGVNPITPQDNALLFSMWAQIPADTEPQCVDIDTGFIAPAGTWVFSKQSGGNVYPAYVDCGIGDIVIGGASCEENHPPTAICIDVTVDADSSCEASASVDGGSYDEDGDPITLDQEPPGPYSLGDTDVILIVTDDEGLADTCDAVVTVVDVTPPVVTCPGDITVGNDIEDCGAIVTFTIDVDDNCPGAIVFSDWNSGDFFPVGLTTVTVTAEDAAANTAFCTFDVTVEDTEDPTPTCPDDTTLSNDPGECGAIAFFDLFVNDNCPGATVFSDWNSGDFFPVGLTTVTVTAEDAAGNTAFCTFDVTVNDVEPPVVTCYEPLETGNDPGECGAVVYYDDYAEAYDNYIHNTGIGVILTIISIKEKRVNANVAGVGSIGSCTCQGIKPADCAMVWSKQNLIVKRIAIWIICGEHYTYWNINLRIEYSIPGYRRVVFSKFNCDIERA